jgi:hypothetical protein
MVAEGLIVFVAVAVILNAFCCVHAQSAEMKKRVTIMVIFFIASSGSIVFDFEDSP